MNELGVFGELVGGEECKRGEDAVSEGDGGGRPLMRSLQVLERSFNCFH